MLTDFISKQAQCLQILDLAANDFSSVGTEKFLTRMVESVKCNPIQELEFNGSLNFDLDASVRKIAEILSISHTL